jgi:hypothetical protein
LQHIASLACPSSWHLRAKDKEEEEEVRRGTCKVWFLLLIVRLGTWKSAQTSRSLQKGGIASMSVSVLLPLLLGFGLSQKQKMGRLRKQFFSVFLLNQNQTLFRKISLDPK